MNNSEQPSKITVIYVISEPIEGEETEYAQHLRNALNKIENFVRYDASIHGYRGLSKNALASLHRAMPEPAWEIEVK